MHASAPWLLVAGLLAGGCSDGPTTLLLHIDVAAGVTVTSLDATVEVGDSPAGVDHPLRMARLPGTLWIRLPDAANVITVALRATTDANAVMQAQVSVAAVPHAQVERTVLLGADVADAGASDGGGPDGFADGGADASPDGARRDAGAVELGAPDLAGELGSAPDSASGAPDLASGAPDLTSSAPDLTSGPPDLASGDLAQGRTILAQDTFMRANMSTWGVASDGHTWGGDANSTGVFSINGGTGQVVSGNYANDALLGPSVADAEVLTSFTLSDYAGGPNTIGPLLRYTDANNLYRAAINQNNFQLGKRVNNVFTALGSSALTPTPGVSYTVRFRVIGTALSAKVWATGTSEPASWSITATDSSLAAGFCGVRVDFKGTAVASYTSFVAMTAP